MAKIVKYRAGGAVTKNTFVKLSSGKTATQTSATATDTIGVQLNTTTTDGDIALVCVEGECEVTAGEAVVAGEYIRPGASGFAEGADATGNVICGLYLGHEVNGTAETVTTPDLITVHLKLDKTRLLA